MIEILKIKFTLCLQKPPRKCVISSKLWTIHGLWCVHTLSFVDTKLKLIFDDRKVTLQQLPKKSLILYIHVLVGQVTEMESMTQKIARFPNPLMKTRSRSETLYILSIFWWFSILQLFNVSFVGSIFSRIYWNHWTNTGRINFQKLQNIHSGRY